MDAPHNDTYSHVARKIPSSYRGGMEVAPGRYDFRERQVYAYAPKNAYAASKIPTSSRSNAEI